MNHERSTPESHDDLIRLCDEARRKADVSLGIAREDARRQREEAPELARAEERAAADFFRTD